jgi:hypothetical protein
LEETGIKVREKDVIFLTAGNNVFAKEGKHYVTIAMGVFLSEDLEPEARISSQVFHLSELVLI